MSPTIISLGWVFLAVPWLLVSMDSSSCVGAPLMLPIVQAVATVVTLGWMWWRAISSWGLWSLLTFMAFICYPHPGWQLWFLGGHLDFTCCDPVGGAFLVEVPSLVEVACHRGISVPSVLFCHVWSNGSLVWGIFFLLARCCHVQLGQSLGDAAGVCPLLLWLVWAAWCLSWQIVSIGLELWETCSWAFWMAKWVTAMSTSSQGGVLNGFAISFPRSFPSWQ